MDLSDEQWALIEPLLPSPPSASRGRPVQPHRAVLDGILWKLRYNAPWYDLPSAYPPHQTCYRRYRQWKRNGLMNEILRVLYIDLSQRGSFDLQRAFRNGTVVIDRSGPTPRCYVDISSLATWQMSVALIFVWLAAGRIPDQASDLASG